MENNGMNEIAISLIDSDIVLIPPLLVFKEKDALISQANNFLKSVKNIEVNEDSIKNAKVGAAAIRKKTEAIETERKRIKKEIMKPYDDFASDIKEITNILNEADTFIREQVKALEEIERAEKKKEIIQIYNLRNSFYAVSLFTFDDFFQERYLNKSISIDKVELEMVSWFEKIIKDIAFINDQPNSFEIMDEYKKCKDVIEAMNIVKSRYTRIEEIKIKVTPPKEPGTFIATFEFSSEIQFYKAKDILKLSGISFKIL